jgi:hypothetical protein
MAEFGTILPFVSDMPNGRSCQMPTFSACSSDLMGRLSWAVFGLPDFRLRIGKADVRARQWLGQCSAPKDRTAFILYLPLQLMDSSYCIP